MTTGSKGLHVVCPIKEDVDFEYSKNFAKICAEFLVKKYPEILTTEISKEKRGKKIFIDILRNHYGATSVAPYAIRARKKAPIATPLEWKDLENDNLTAQTYNIFNIFDLLKEKNDPWKNFKKQKKSLSRSLELLTKITK